VPLPWVDVPLEARAVSLMRPMVMVAAASLLLLAACSTGDPPSEPVLLWQDNFERSDQSPLGKSPAGITWSGGTTVALEQGSARLAESQGQAFALHDGYYPGDIRVDATFALGDSFTAGLVWRADPRAWVGSWLQLTLDGDDTGVTAEVVFHDPATDDDQILGSTSGLKVAPGTHQVSASQLGSEVSVLVDGDEILEVRVPEEVSAALDGTATGFYLAGPGVARVEQISTTRLGPRVLVDIDVVAHRGSMLGLGPDAEEKIETLDALPAELDGIEVDVRLSSDGVPVLMHDDTVDRTTSGSGQVNEFTAAELNALGVPTLADYLAEAGKRDYRRVLVQSAIAPEPATAAVLSASGLNAALWWVGSPSSLAQQRTLFTGQLGAFGVSLENVDRDLALAQEQEASLLFVPPGDVGYMNNRGAIPIINTVGIDSGASVVNASWAVRQVIADGVDVLLTDQAEQILLALR
jgi:hypothetical protein